MKYKKLIYWVLGFMLFVGWTDLVWGQTTRRASTVEVINDDNFKKKTAKGFVLIKFTAPYQMKKLDTKLFNGIKGFEGCVILEVDRSSVKKAVKKLRIRNYPSLVLFHNGKKVEVWKGDMDGVVDVTNKDIKKAISDAMAGDVY
jgi:thioredoxin-like negative regulator of GroEL|tara:strand:+ start:261 stop:692 length:432 start_codon:yes stop_codon:yes gene_type:complete